MRWKMSVLTFAAAGMLAGRGSAQMSPDSAIFIGGAAAAAPFQTKAATIDMRIDTMDAAPVKGAPFCATVATEHTQQLADGNRIHTTDSSMLCRDSEGRTRREAGLNLLGAAPQTSAPKLITIVDPVAGARYLLDTGSKVAHKMVLSHDAPETAGSFGSSGKVEHMMIYQRTGSPTSDVLFNNVVVKKSTDDSSESAPNTESLGDQTIEGIHATGTRVTTTIPAGKMGNEKPIVVTSERWYSSDLKTTVMTKHDDPWAGELKTEFKNVNTAEPDSSLFTVPADYKIVDDKDGPMKIKITTPGPPPQ